MFVPAKFGYDYIKDEEVETQRKFFQQLYIIDCCVWKMHAMARNVNRIWANNYSFVKIKREQNSCKSITTQNAVYVIQLSVICITN